jgi:hypothetical protein
MEKYYVLYVTSDGNNSIEVLDKYALEKGLDDEKWGEDILIADDPMDLDTFRGLIIIKGEIVCPKKIATKISYKIK